MDIYYETLNERPDIGWFLQGHMVLEFMLRKRLKDRKGTTATSLEQSSFYRILQIAHQNGVVNTKQKAVLEKINHIRNKYAHELTYRPTLAEWIELWENAKESFSDMTDGIEQGLADLYSAKNLEDADRFHLNELFVQICHDI